MNLLHTEDSPPVILKSHDSLGLFVHYDVAKAEDFQGCMEADEIKFSMNPAEAACLAQPGKAVFVFGRQHPRYMADCLELCGEDVVMDSSVILPEDLYHPPVKQLLSLDEPRRDERTNYAALGISSADVPDLIRMASDTLLHEGPDESPVVYAPVHAWRALGELRAPEAIAPLVQLLQRVDETLDDWLGEDVPRVLGDFGAAVIVPVAVYLADTTRGEWSRVIAAKTLRFVGKSHPELRNECVAVLNAQLERFAEQSETINAFLISPLIDLQAVESMPLIERAFASGRVDEMVAGDVEDVEIELGLKKQREHPRKPNKLSIMGDQLRATFAAAGLPVPDASGNFPRPEDDFIEMEDYSPSLDYKAPAISLPHIAPPKVGRNDPCPCASGKKFKKCCGA